MIVPQADGPVEQMPGGLSSRERCGLRGYKRRPQGPKPRERAKLLADALSRVAVLNARLLDRYSWHSRVGRRRKIQGAPSKPPTHGLSGQYRTNRR